MILFVSWNNGTRIPNSYKIAEITCSSKQSVELQDILLKLTLSVIIVNIFIYNV